ncbi:heavy-metal-associated domain-containing protein [Myroides sp. LJL116]
MKVIKFFALVAFASFITTSCQQGSTASDQNEQVEQIQEVAPKSNENQVAELQQATFHVEGMTCEVGCASFIQKKLSDLPGVTQATVDFDTKTATVVYQQNQQTPEVLTQTVEKIANGLYQVSDMQTVSYTN